MVTIKFWNELPSFKEWLESSLVRFLTAWLPWRPSLTKGFLYWFAALRWHGLSGYHLLKLLRNMVVVRWKVQSCQNRVKFYLFHLNTTWFLGIFIGTYQRNGQCQLLRAPSQLKKPFVGESRWDSHEQGNWRDLIEDFRLKLAANFKTW